MYNCVYLLLHPRPENHIEMKSPSDAATQSVSAGHATLIKCSSASAIFIICLLSTLAFPYIAIWTHSILPVYIGNLLYFFPQEIFPYSNFVAGPQDGEHAVFSDSIALLLNIIQWGVVTPLFAWLCRNFRHLYLFPAAFGTLFILRIIVQLLFQMFGVRLELDGP